MGDFLQKDNMVLPLCLRQTSIDGFKYSMMDAKKITDDLRNGRPENVFTLQAVHSVEAVIRADRRITLDEIVPNLDMSHSIVYAIVPEMFHFQKLVTIGFQKC